MLIAMKKSFIFIIAALSAMLAACTPEVAPVLEVASKSVDFTYEESQGSIELNSSSDIVVAEADQDWVSTTIRRKTIVVRVYANEQEEARTANIYIKNADNLSVNVQVSQKGVKYAFDGEDQTIGSEGGNIVLPYKADDKMVVVIADGCDWVTAEVLESSVVFSVEPNDAVSSRNVVVKYAISSKSSEMKITQEAHAAYVTFTPALEDISSTSAPAEFTYNYVTNSTIQVEEDLDWLNVVAKDGVLTVRMDMNNSLKPREGSFTYKLKDAPADVKTVKVTQAAAEKVVIHFDVVDAEGAAVTEAEAESGETTVSVTVKTNAPFTSVASETFVTVDPASDENAELEEKVMTVTLKVAANPTSEERSATVTFSATNKADADFEDYVITVKQAPYYTVALATTNVTYDTVAWTATPNGDSFPYLVDMMKASYASTLTDQQLFDEEIEYYEELGEKYSMTLEEVLDILAYVGEDSSAFEKLKAETEYQLYAMPYVYEDGKASLIGDVTRLNVTTLEDPFKFWGTAVWHDVFVSTIFDMEGSTIDMPCDVYTDATQPGKYFFKSPYNYANIASWFDSTPEEMKQYTGNWKDVMLELDATNEAKVKMAIQDLGVSMSSSYGWISGGMYYGAPSYDNYGTLAENTFTFVGDGSTKYVYWSMEKYSNGALKVSKLASNFTVKMTKGGSPVYPSAVKAAPASKRTVNRAAEAKLPSKEMKRDFHIMAVPVQF